MSTYRMLGVGAALLWSATAFAAPNSWVEGTQGASDGVSREFYNRGARLLWRQELGDWRDRDGAAYGDNPWASAQVDDTDTARFIEWEITELVSAWRDGDLVDEGVFLRGSGDARFASREHAIAGERPQLVVTVGGAATTLEPTGDTFTEASTFQPQGNGEELSVSASNNALLRFDLSAVPNGAIESAQLRIFTTRQFGSGSIGVFVPDPGPAGGEPALEGGFAADYDDDVGVEGHPDVVLFEDFEAADWMDHWSQHGGEFDIADGDPAFGFEALGGKALRARVPEGGNTALNTTYQFMDKQGEEPEEIYFRYYLRLGDDWDQSVDGGKLPGIAGTYGVAGWGGRKSDGTNGWSARGLFVESIPPGLDNPLAAHTPMGSYVYHADMPGDFGDNFIWNEGWGPNAYGGVLETQRWYCVEHYLKLNTLGANDGILRGWIDGRLSVEKSDLRFRDVDTLKIEEIWMNIYHGGTAPSPYDQHAFVDNVVIARSYIGPMGPLDEPGGETGDSGDSGSGGSGGGDDGPGGTSGGGTTGGGTSTSGPGASDDEDGGCSCRTHPSGALGLPLLVLFALARRRRDRSSAGPPGGG